MKYLVCDNEAIADSLINMSDGIVVMFMLNRKGITLDEYLQEQQNYTAKYSSNVEDDVRVCVPVFCEDAEATTNIEGVIVYEQIPEEFISSQEEEE